jgi:succinate dehydrogenase flavin-adding protein (antitoxin of CptAB toxin-antitoxin module)
VYNFEGNKSILVEELDKPSYRNERSEKEIEEVLQKVFEMSDKELYDYLVKSQSTNFSIFEKMFKSCYKGEIEKDSFKNYIKNED